MLCALLTPLNCPAYTSLQPEHLWTPCTTHPHTDACNCAQNFCKLTMAPTSLQVSNSMRDFIDGPAATLLVQSAATLAAAAAVPASVLKTYIGLAKTMQAQYVAFGSPPSQVGI